MATVLIKWLEATDLEPIQLVMCFQGNKVINRGILLNLSEKRNMELRIEAFELMSELRLLLINFAIFEDSGSAFGHFPASLKWLEWKGCPLEELPLEIKCKSLVVLNLSGSFISRLWSETTTGSNSKCREKMFDGLKVLDLSCCNYLNATPTFAVTPNLKKLILDECRYLKEIDDSIGSLKKLVFLSIRECVSLEKLPNQIYGLRSLEDLNLEGCSNLVAFPQFPATNSKTGFSKLKQLILRNCQSLEDLPDLQKFQSLRNLHIDGCQCLDHRRKHLFEDVAFREWDELSISGSRTESLNQEFSFLLPVGSSNDPLLLQQLQCQGNGDPCKNGTIKLLVRHEDMTNYRVILETTYEAYCDNSMYMDDVHNHCYAINFGSSDKINEVPRGKTIIMKVRPDNNFELRKVDVKVQKRSKFTHENMKTFISVSRRDFHNELSIFFGLQETNKLHAIKYSTRIEKRKEDMDMQLNVPCGEQRLLFDWTIEDLVIFTVIFGDIKDSWYEQQHGTGLPRRETAKVFDKIKVLDLSCCKFLVKTLDLARMPNLEELILDHCECLLEIGESIGQLKNLILLSMVGCANLCAIPCGILQLNSLHLLNLKGCSKIEILPEADMMDVRLVRLEQLILDHCTSLTEIPDYVGGLKCLRCLSLKGCSSLNRLPVSLDNLKSLIKLQAKNCVKLNSVPDLSNLTGLEELNVKNCRRLTTIPGLQKLRSLKLLHMNGCRDLYVHMICFQLEEAAFDDLQAFSIGSERRRSKWDDVDWDGDVHRLLERAPAVSLPFPRGGCMRNEHPQLEKMDVLIERRKPEHEIMDASVLNVCVAVRPRLFPAAGRLQLVLQLRQDLESPEADCRSYTARFGKDDEINKRLRVEATTATPVSTLHISCQDPAVWKLRADVWFRT